MSDQIVAWMERVSGRLDAQETILDLLRQEVRASTTVAEMAGKALETIAAAEERRVAQAAADADRRTHLFERIWTSQPIQITLLAIAFIIAQWVGFEQLVIPEVAAMIDSVPITETVIEPQ